MKKPDVADARRDERLLHRGCRRWFEVPKPDQQIAAQPDQFPADEEQQQVVGDHQPQHRRRKQRHKTEEPREILVLGHVPRRVDENHQADERDHRRHPRRQRVENEAHVEAAVVPNLNHVKFQMARSTSWCSPP